MKSEVQVVFIDGGMTFRDKKDYLDFLKNREITLEDQKTWNEGDYLEDSLENEVVKVEMPCRDNARYDEWEITFEKYIPLLSDQVILVGLSLGGTFLAKYLSENSFPKDLVSAYLIGTPYDDDLIAEELAGGFNVDPDLSGLEQNCGNLTLMFSEDDDVVPVRHADKYRQKLSDAEIITYESKEGHFQVAKFPELVEKIYKEVEKQ